MYVDIMDRVKVDLVEADSTKFVVYKVTNIVNGNFYIGATRRGLKIRKDQHLFDCRANKKSCPVLYAAIRKYGEDNFYWKVLAVVNSTKELLAKEIELIAELKPEYNMTNGGNGVIGAVRTPEWLANMSKALKGRVGSKAWLGKKMPEKAIKKSKATRRARNPGKVEGKLTQERLKQLLSYNPETGKFFRLVCINQFAGRETGDYNKQDNTVRITLDGKSYLAHRLAWFYMYGEWHMIQHKNKNRSDNRLENLRVTNSSLIRVNCKATNTLGVKGVYLVSNKFEARIRYRGKSFYLGLFETVERASQAYRNKSAELHSEI